MTAASCCTTSVAGVLNGDLADALTCRTDGHRRLPSSRAAAR